MEKNPRQILHDLRLDVMSEEPPGRRRMSDDASVYVNGVVWCDVVWFDAVCRATV